MIVRCDLYLSSDALILYTMNSVNCHYHFCGTGSFSAQNSVPLLPTDGGNFVALQKKSLTEESSDPHLV